MAHKSERQLAVVGVGVVRAVEEELVGALVEASLPVCQQLWQRLVPLCFIGHTVERRGIERCPKHVHVKTHILARSF